jgi:hypothetical protein
VNDHFSLCDGAFMDVMVNMMAEAVLVLEFINWTAPLS